MVISLIIASAVHADMETPACPTACDPGYVCVNSFTSQSAGCVQIPAASPLEPLRLPFDTKTEAVCTHASGLGSHSGTNAFYALDLATDYARPAAVIVAAADGEAFVIVGEDGKLCPEPKGGPAQAETSECGQGWGNRVKLLHAGGYFSYYVHLDHPLVHTGQWVRRGEPLGVEGWTGNAGHRHLHWSVQKLPRRTAAQWRSKILEYTGESVPFRFRAMREGTTQVFSVEAVHCAHANIGFAPAAQQPRFRAAN